MSAHTPGPWCVYLTDAPAFGPPTAFNPIGACGCCNSPWVNGATDAEKEANARLIAAAPNLLAALSDFLENPQLQVGVGGNPIVVDKMLADARSALTLARGNSP